jgi:thiol-disulfide isomerase/thioredoxin
MPLTELIEKRSMPHKTLVYEDIKRQKNYLARILKENNGPAFDLLEVLNFTSKIKQDMTLDEWGIENLKQLKAPLYYNYVIRKNELLSSRLKNTKEKSNSIIFDATTEKNNYFEDILSLHAGNIVMVNYWSMGCRPCYIAIENIEPLKINYRNRKVVFIYLTGDRSLFSKWENKAVQIEGMHYRLNKKQIDYILSKYEMKNSTPGFLVFDKNGKCIYNQNGYSEVVIKNIFDTMDKEL